LTSIKGVNRSFEEISHFVGDILTQGNILDIGTGPGRLLFEISKQTPLLKLFGLDISKTMIDLGNLPIYERIELKKLQL